MAINSDGARYTKKLSPIATQVLASRITQAAVSQVLPPTTIARSASIGLANFTGRGAAGWAGVYSRGIGRANLPTLAESYFICMRTL